MLGLVLLVLHNCITCFACSVHTHTHTHARKPARPPARPPTPTHTTHTWQSLENVKHEIEIMRKVNHPNCIKLYDIYESSKHVYIVMELVCSHAPPLSSLLARSLSLRVCSLTVAARLRLRVLCVCLHTYTRVMMRKHLNFLVPSSLLHFLCFATSLFAACACTHLPPHIW